MALVLGRVGPPEILFRDRRRAEMRVVEDRPVVARGDERARQVGFPDPLSAPRPARPATALAANPPPPAESTLPGGQTVVVAKAAPTDAVTAISKPTASIG